MARAKRVSVQKQTRLWDGVTEEDFINEPNLVISDIAEFDMEYMIRYAMNMNLWRHLPQIEDSLKPVERRLIWSCYNEKAIPGSKIKSNDLTGTASKFHAHGDSYPSLVRMAQDWKESQPPIAGKGNFANIGKEDYYAAARYTEVSLSKYGYECFVEDYDPDCVEMVFNSASGKMEPLALPSKFPNALVNGGTGFMFGNAYACPPYNINDIIEVCKRMIQDPETSDIFMIPDLPTGCQVIDDGHSFQEIIETGRGVLKMRGDAEIIETPKNWIIRITSIPWMSSFNTDSKSDGSGGGIVQRIHQLSKKGILPIKDVQDGTEAKLTKDGMVHELKYDLIVDKAHDPYAVLQKLYSKAGLQQSLGIIFNMIEGLSIKTFTMRELIQSWIDQRRSYKRRVLNKRLNTISARISLLDVLITLCTGNNLTKTVKIIQTYSESEGIAALMRLADMDSYQASKIFEMPMRAFSKDAKARYEAERERLSIEQDRLIETIGSEKKIDEIIIGELECLRKYATPRRSKIVAEETGQYISNTMHQIIITNGNLLKKLGYDEEHPEKSVSMGSFKTGDFPVHHCIVRNTSSITMLDTFGKYSIIPVHTIDNCELSNYGIPVFDLAKLSGRIVTCMESYDTDLIKRVRKYGEPFLVTITENGYAKKTPMSTFVEMRNKRSVKAMTIRDDDALIAAGVLLENTVIIIYTQRGDYTMLRVSDIATQAKDSMGLITMRVKDGDRVAGYAAIGQQDQFIVILTDKGMLKRVNKQYFGDIARRGVAKDQASLITLDNTDRVRFVSSMNSKSKLMIALRGNTVTIPFDDIPDQTKKAKGRKMCYPSSTSNIVGASIIE